MPGSTVRNGLKVPSVYQAGYDRTCALNPHLADQYIKHTCIGDPLADAVIDSLAPFSPGEVNRFIKAGMQQDVEVLTDAPRLLRDFFDSIESPPEWFDPAILRGGYRAFHSYSDLFIPAFFVATLQNASTLIAKAFYASGRTMSGFGPRRVRQNTRHFIEIMLPGALDRQGDGWKLSVRIRLVHAQLRRLIRDQGNWDEEVFGTPLSAAHMALASANFSATTLRQAERLGAEMDEEMRRGYMHAWRYASSLIGTPEFFLFEGDEGETHELYRIATSCEPPPSDESVVIANALVNALPKIAGKTELAEHQAFLSRTYRVSRALLGDDLADQLQFPQCETKGLLGRMRLLRQVHAMSHKLAPNIAQKWRGNNFVFLLEASMLDDLRYRLPDHLQANMATPW